MRLPLRLPPFHGIEPRLALEYGSARTNGCFGAGWRLTGLSSIQRVSPGGGVPRFDATDRFQLDGLELKPSPTNASVYLTPEPVARELVHDARRQRWRLTSVDGTRRTYARLPSRESATRWWVMIEEEDAGGNVVAYEYSGETDPPAPTPLRVHYGALFVDFHAEPRPDPLLVADRRELHLTSGRIKAITLHQAGQLVGGYAFDYTRSAASARSLLTQLRLFGPAARLDPDARVEGDFRQPPVQLAYGHPDLALSHFDEWLPPRQPPSVVALLDPAFEEIGDFDGDGRDDVLEWRSEAAGDPLGWYLTASRGTRFAPARLVLGARFGQSGNTRAPPGSRFAGDFDGDGCADLLWYAPDGPDAGWYVARGAPPDRAGSFAISRWLPARVDGLGATHTGSGPGPFLQYAGDFNGDGKTDFIWMAHAAPVPGWYIAMSNGRGFTPPTFALPRYVGENAHCATVGYTFNVEGQPHGSGLADLNGDGRADYYWFYEDGSQGPAVDGWYVALANAAGTGFDPPQCWVTQGMPGAHCDAFPDEEWGDFNGDGLHDFLAKVNYHDRHPSGWHLFQSQVGQRPGLGLVLSDAAFRQAVIPPRDENGGSTSAALGRRFVADVNGDGRADLVWFSAGGPRPGWLAALGGTGDADQAWRIVRWLDAPSRDGPGPTQGDGMSGLADFNGDGLPDLLWRPSASGPWLVATNRCGTADALLLRPSEAQAFDAMARRLFAAPAWWTVGRALAVAGLAAGLAGAALGWVVLLRRQVRQQTAWLEARFEREAELEQQFRALFDHANDFLFICDLAGRCTAINPAALQLLGLTRDQALGRPIEEFLAPEHRHLFPDPRPAAADPAGPVPFEAEVLDRAGRRSWLEFSLRRMLRGGAPFALEGIGRNVTERKRAADFLAQARLAADAANRAKSSFLANLSHELRTPMNAILGYTQLLERAPDLPAAHRTSVETIGRSGEHLLGLIDEILDLARIEAGRIELRSARFDLTLLLRDLERMFQPRVAAKGLVLRIDVGDLSPNPDAYPPFRTDMRAAALPVGEGSGSPGSNALSAAGQNSGPPDGSPRVSPAWVGDERRLRQVLINLLGNAVKFTPTGSVTLAVERIRQTGLPAPAPAAGTPPATAWLRFTVTDTGPGIPAELRPRLFQPFERGSDAAPAEGTGLGLAITRRLVEIMGGELGFVSPVTDRSAPPGARFWFRLPFTPVPDPTPPGPAPHAATTALPRVRLDRDTPLQALVVDDVPANRAVLAEALAALGCAVTTATSGEEAVATSLALPLDILFMDLRLPGLDGREAARRIRECSGPSPGPILVALSASADVAEPADGPDVVFARSLTKPFQFGQLLECLRLVPGARVEATSGPPTGAPEAGEGIGADWRLPEPLRLDLLAAVAAYNLSQFDEHLARLDQQGAPARALATRLRTLLRQEGCDAVQHALSVPSAPPAPQER